MLMFWIRIVNKGRVSAEIVPLQGRNPFKIWIFPPEKDCIPGQWDCIVAFDATLTTYLLDYLITNKLRILSDRNLCLPSQTLPWMSQRLWCPEGSVPLACKKSHAKQVCPFSVFGEGVGIILPPNMTATAWGRECWHCLWEFWISSCWRHEKWFYAFVLWHFLDYLYSYLITSIKIIVSIKLSVLPYTSNK